MEDLLQKKEEDKKDGTLDIKQECTSSIELDQTSLTRRKLGVGFWPWFQTSSPWKSSLVLGDCHQQKLGNSEVSEVVATLH